MSGLKEWNDLHEAEYCALGNRVLAFATANKIVGDWAAYIDAVQGENHDREFEELLKERRSNKLSHEIAKFIFPYFDEKYKWRS